MKKALSLLLALMTVASLVACASDSGTTSDTSASPDAADTTVADTEEAAVTEDLSDNLPEADYDGYEFRIGLANESNLAHVLAPEINGEVTNDAIYSANRTVEERFNVALTPVYYGDSLNNVKNSILAQDDIYDTVSGHDISMGSLSLEGLFLDINSIPHLDYSKPWWPSYSVDSLTVGGHMLIFSNFISYGAMRLTSLVYFNKDIATNYGLDMPYDKVFDGAWTLDEMTAMAKDVYEDVNGNSVRDEADTYGLVLSPSLYRVQESFGVQPIREDEDGKLYIYMNNERTISLLEKFYALAYNTTGGFYHPEDAEYSFNAGSAMFIFSSFRYAVGSLRESEISYGFLPIPKFDETQDNYISGSNDRPYAVPLTVVDTDKVGVIIEAMSAEGYKQVRPAYIDIAMKQKYAYDEESAKVLDIVTNTMLLDLAYIYGGSSGFGFALMNSLKPENANTDFASYYAATITSQETLLNKMQDAFDKIG